MSSLIDLDDDCLQAVVLQLPLATTAAFSALCWRTAGLVSVVRDELEWARRATESGFDLQAAARLAELKGMPRVAAHFGHAPLTIHTLEVAVRLLNNEPVTGSAQLQHDISVAGGEVGGKVRLAECILSDRGWARLPRAPLTVAGARMVSDIFQTTGWPHSSHVPPGGRGCLLLRRPHPVLDGRHGYRVL